MQRMSWPAYVAEILKARSEGIMSSSIPSHLYGRFIMHKFTIASVMSVLLTAGVVFCSAAYGDQSEELIDAARKDDSNQVQPHSGQGR